MSESLKPCPFCGGEAKIEIDEDGSAFITVEHEDCCYLDGVDTTQWFYAYDGKNPAQVAAEAWNRRAERTCRPIHTREKWECGACGCEIMPGFMPVFKGVGVLRYCPHCGAKVVGE